MFQFVYTRGRLDRKPFFETHTILVIQKVMLVRLTPKLEKFMGHRKCTKETVESCFILLQMLVKLFLILIFLFIHFLNKIGEANLLINILERKVVTMEGGNGRWLKFLHKVKTLNYIKCC